MRIAIDVTALQTQHRYRGIGTYTRNLVTQLAAIGGQHSFLLISESEQLQELANLPANFTHIQVNARRLGRLKALASHQFLLPVVLFREKVDVFHAPAISTVLTIPGPPLVHAVPMVITIFDLIPLRHPTLFIRQPYRRVFYALMLHAARSATHFIAISKQTKHDLIQHLGVNPDRISVTYLAPDPIFFDQPEMATSIVPLERPYILHVGGGHANKNLGAVIQAYNTLRQMGFAELRLVLVGSGLPDVSKLDYSGSNNDVVCLSTITREQLREVYRHASVFVFPSCVEGFGLPPLEAMAVGVPVVCSRIPSLTEVVGDAALQVDPSDTCALADAVRAILSDANLRTSLIRLGQERAASFSWERTARETLEIYERLSMPIGPKRAYA